MENTTTTSNLLITTPDGGEHLWIAGSRYRVILSGDETNGNMAIIEMNVPPGSGPLPHEHPAFMESFYVLEGEVEMRTKDQVFLAEKGAMVTIPLNGPVHAFKNNSQAMARLLCIVSPSGLDAMFREVGRPATGDTPPPAAPPTAEEKQKAMETATRYNTRIYPPNYFDEQS
ncbi:MAG: cupin domain-containing protein [Flavipsychrobacter sp.]|nr:cupin domain-containing protein [Flavipsychrobacter sp.]